MRSRDHTCRFKMSRRGGSGIASLELFTDCAIDCKKFKKTADSVLKSITDVSADIAVSELNYLSVGDSCLCVRVGFTSRMARRWI